VTFLKKDYKIKKWVA